MNCVYLDSKSTLAAAHRRAFPPSVVVEVKAVACELPKLLGKPLSRFSMTEIRREVIERGLVAKISGATLWRWLDQDAIRPWRYRSWISPYLLVFILCRNPYLDLPPSKGEETEGYKAVS